MLTIVRALEDAATDESLRAIVISSTGPDFCSGADWVSTQHATKGSATGPGPAPAASSAARRCRPTASSSCSSRCSSRWCAAVRGWAAGLGCQIALAADFTVATDTSRFWEPFLQRGFSPDSGATWLLPRLVGMARAKELLLLGRELSGRRRPTGA